MTTDNLLPFYFGSIDDQERLKIEQKMLVDPEVLLDYLDLKRQMESAALVPQQPSRALWNRLQPKLSRRSRITIALGFAVAVAASIVLAFLILQKPAANETSGATMGEKILFDSDSEHFSHSNVL